MSAITKVSVIVSIVILSNLVFAAPRDSDGNWPQWRGPRATGISNETGLIKTWPENGPAVLWRIPSGTGFSGVSVSDGRLVTMIAEKGAEWIVCYDPEKGKALWRFKLDESPFKSRFGDGPRATPLIDNNAVYCIGGNGKLAVLNLKTGEKIWSRDLHADYGAKIPGHGISSSPIVEKDLLLVNVAGGEGFAFIAFNKKTGKVVWNTHSEQPGYSTPLAITVAGIRQVIFFAGTAAVSVSPDDGRVFWKYPWETNYNVNAATPVFVPENKLLISSGYGKGAALLEIKKETGKPTVKSVWESKLMRNHFSSSVYYEGNLYGFDEGTLKCLDLNTRETRWAKRGFQKGSFMIADGQLIVLGERGQLALIAARPDEYVENAKTQVLKGRCWTVPTLANGILYVRNQEEMVAIDMKK